MAGVPPWTAELNFADVFGGPPRRSSGNERLSIRGSLDGSSLGSPAPRAWSGEAEAPVFGDRGSGDRRRHLGEEFYRDIFPASEAAVPRRAGAADWEDVFGAPASPGSTSTTRPPSSFSMKFNRGADSSMPTSPSRQTSNGTHDGTSYTGSVQTLPDSKMNNYLAQQTPPHDCRKKPFSWHRYPFLSRLRSQSGDKKNASNHFSSMESEAEGTPDTMENIMDANKLHFSFYKWAGKGALLVLPATMEEKDAAIIGLKSFPQVVVQGFDLIDEEDSMSIATGASKSHTDYEDSKPGKYSTNSATKEGHVSLFFDDEYMQGMKHSTDYSKNDVSADSPSAKSSRRPSIERSRSSRVKEKVKDFMKIFSPHGSPKHKRALEAQDLASSAKNESKTELQDKFTVSSSEASEDVKTTHYDQNAFINVPSPMSEMPETMEKSVLIVNSKMEGNADTTSAINETAPDALKDFMKIFSPEGSLKHKCAPEAQDQTSSAKNESKTELHYKFTVSSSAASEDVKTTQNNQNSFIDVLSPMSEMLERMEKPVLTANGKMEGKVDTTSRNETVPNELFGIGREDKLDNTIHHGETYFEDLDGCLVISMDPVLHNHNDEEKEQIKIAESKIHEWSRGKGGNIRSLLSTLQCVLWPESGWKPIPLVDVIEGAAVKKAYQKALLCLHPDKLQQRGASMHQKYIAEKVFDILQESWKEFNSVTFG